MPTAISVRGDIARNDDAWVYDFLGLECTTPGSFRAQLDEAAGDDVTVEVNSPGGSTTAGAEIYEAIRSYPGNVTVHIVGMAASAASVIACAAESTITPAGTFFVHRCSVAGVSGNAGDLKQAAQQCEAVDESIMGAYRAKTGMDDAQLYRLMERETMMSAQRAVELGFVDAISEPVSATGTPAAGYAFAAGAGTSLDPSAIAPDALRAMREEYLKAHEAPAGGEDMADTSITELAEPVEPVATEPAEPAEQAPTYEDGIAAERARIRAIDAMARNIPADMVEAAKYGDPISAEELAVRFLSEERDAASAYMGAAKADAEASGSANVAALAPEDAGEKRSARNAALADKINRRLSK